MPIERLLDRVHERMEALWDARKSPDDEILWDVSLILTEDEDGDPMTSAAFLVSLAAPELGPQTHSTAQFLVGAERLISDSSIDAIATQIWDTLCSQRLMQAVAPGLDSTTE